MAQFYDTSVTGNLSLLGGLYSKLNSFFIAAVTTLNTGQFTAVGPDVIGGLVFCTGGGGAGGNAYVTDNTASSGGGGGGAGGTAIRYYPYSQLHLATVSVGAGGVISATNGGSGGAGGNTVFTPANAGTVITGTGGAGGTGTGTLVSGVDSRSGGTGGNGTNGITNLQGGAGAAGYGSQAISGLLAVGGQGGESFWGGNFQDFVTVVAGTSIGGYTGDPYGAGNGGPGGIALNTSAINGPGQNGEDGRIIVIEFRAL